METMQADQQHRRETPWVARHSPAAGARPAARPPREALLQRALGNRYLEGAALVQRQVDPEPTAPRETAAGVVASAPARPEVSLEKVLATAERLKGLPYAFSADTTVQEIVDKQKALWDKIDGTIKEIRARKEKRKAKLATDQDVEQAEKELQEQRGQLKALDESLARAKEAYWNSSLSDLFTKKAGEVSPEILNAIEKYGLVCNTYVEVVMRLSGFSDFPLTGAAYPPLSDEYTGIEQERNKQAGSTTGWGLNWAERIVDWALANGSIVYEDADPDNQQLAITPQPGDIVIFKRPGVGKYHVNMVVPDGAGTFNLVGASRPGIFSGTALVTPFKQYDDRLPARGGSKSIPSIMGQDKYLWILRPRYKLPAAEPAERSPTSVQLQPKAQPDAPTGAGGDVMLRRLSPPALNKVPQHDRSPGPLSPRADTPPAIMRQASDSGASGAGPAAGAEAVAGVTLDSQADAGAPSAGTAAPAPVTPTVHITAADITADRIVLALDASGAQGELTLQLVGPEPGLHTIRSVARAAGTYTETFDIPGLAVGEYTSLRATWRVGGVNYTYDQPYHIRVLGSYHHSQYNIPHESTCGGVPDPAYLTNSACNFTPTTFRHQFVSQVNLNGSGVSIAHGGIKREFFCLSQTGAPEDANERSFRQVGAFQGSCGALNAATVAYRPGHPFLQCHDRVLIHPIGVKTVTDLCPGCATAQLDNFTTQTACGGVPDLGDFMTIKLW